MRATSLDITELSIPDVKILKPKQFGDHRGFFSETYNKRLLAEFGIDADFVQDNHSRSASRGTLRGLHFQTPPHAQDKLVRVVRGRILDVAVDIRHGSTTFGQSVSAEISDEEWNQIWVPSGFAHGFITLTEDVEVIYKVTNYFAPEHDFGLAWDDPALGIDWPIDVEKITLSDRDRQHPTLADLPHYFSINH